MERSFAAVLRLHGIEHVEIPPGQPSTNGLSERIVRVFKEALKQIVVSMTTLYTGFQGFRVKGFDGMSGCRSLSLDNARG